MKPLLTIFASFLCLYSLCQKFEVTPEGLRNLENDSLSYIIVEFDSLSSQELYNRTVDYIKTTYKNPDEVIKSNIEGKYIRFDTYVSNFSKVNNGGVKLVVSMKYTTTIKFKEGKIKYEISNIDISANEGGRKVKFKGSIWTGYPIYNEKNGKLKQPETKTDIEKYFNSQISELTKALFATEDTDW